MRPSGETTEEIKRSYVGKMIALTSSIILPSLAEIERRTSLWRDKVQDWISKSWCLLPYFTIFASSDKPIGATISAQFETYRR